MHDYLLFVSVHAFTCFYGTFYIFPDTAVDELLSDYNTIDDHIAGNQRPYPDIFQRSIISPRMHELYHTHYML